MAAAIGGESSSSGPGDRWASRASRQPPGERRISNNSLAEDGKFQQTDAALRWRVSLGLGGCRRRSKNEGHMLMLIPITAESKAGDGVIFYLRTQSAAPPRCVAETSSRHTGCPACLDVLRYNRSYGRIFSEAIPERQTLSRDCSRGVHVCCSRLAESISWIYVDTLRLSNEMCGGGLTETDGGDYRISDCKAGRQIGRGEGLISELLIRHSSSALQKRGGNRASLRQDSHRFLHLHCLLVRANA